MFRPGGGFLTKRKRIDLCGAPVVQAETHFL
jgi:hypothetical protein